jgi:hypothetical protein
MSDYGDDYSDYGEDWLYIEEEYIVADDLAEHAVPSPPPTVYDEDVLLDWDRFDYYNDLEYASDGYDDARFRANDGAGAAKIGQKRKRGATATHGRKKQRLTDPGVIGQDNAAMRCESPVVWRPQTSRGTKPRILTENVESYALMKNWREELADTSGWTRYSSGQAFPGKTPSNGDNVHASSMSGLSAASEADVDEGEEDVDIDPAALMAVLQERLAAAGGPLNGMDPQQLLDFAMRMATDKDAGDEIAGEMADEMLGQGDEDEEDEEAEEKLMSWVAQQRNTNDHSVPNTNSPTAASAPKSPEANHGGKRPPTPPSSEANRSVRLTDEVMRDVERSAEDTTVSVENNALGFKQVSRKRKAVDATDVEDSSTTTKRRATRSYEAPTASSQARTTVPKTTRSGRVKR